MKAIKFLFIISFVFTFSGCGEIEQGTIVDKQFKPAYAFIQTMYVNKVFISRPIRVPDSWYITIEGFYKNKRQERRIRVSEELFLSVSLGETFDLRGINYSEAPL
jgi:hypothetical protein